MIYLHLITLLASVCVRLSSAQWTFIGISVQYRQLDRITQDTNNVLITYAGYDVDVSHIWTDRLLSHSILNETKYGIKHAYSVLGPRNSVYIDREIENTKLIDHLYKMVLSKNKPKLILVISHSSGSYVADEFFESLYNRILNEPNDPVYAALIKRLVYYNLDGAITPVRKDNSFIQKLFSSVNFVWSSKGSLIAMNGPAMIHASTLYESIQTVKSVEVVTNKADCLNNRCMHEALIIENPYNPLGYDDGDYTLFNSNGREVQSAYLNPNVLLNTINS